MNPANIQLIHTKNLRWIDIVNPSADEVAWLQNHFRFHEPHVTALPEHQHRPRIEFGTGYDYIVLLFPVYRPQSRDILPGEVDFFVGDNFLITAHYGEIHTLKEFFTLAQTDAETRNASMQKGAGYLLFRILEGLLKRSYPILDHMSEDLDKIEEKIFDDANIKKLSNIARMKKNIIEFRKMMKTHRYILNKLPRRQTSYLAFSQSKTDYKNLLEYSENIWDILDAMKETVETLQDTTQALATHRLNEITKIISIFSAIVLPATLITFLFGIGVEGIPFRHNPYGFWIVAGFMMTSSLLILLIFKMKKWF